jgi:hypothetical protein
LWAKGPNAKDIHKEMFPVCGECLSRKAVHNWVEEVEDNARLGATVAETTDVYAASFDAQVKQWDKCINVDGGYVEK